MSRGTNPMQNIFDYISTRVNVQLRLLPLFTEVDNYSISLAIQAQASASARA